MFAIRTILCPTDFSDCSRNAFRLAGALARVYGARLLVLHVNQTLGPMVAYGQTLARLQPAEYQQKLGHALRRFHVPGFEVGVEHRLAQGDPVSEILRAARDSNCDLIIMGTHGRSVLRRFLMGSVAGQVLRRATCPVLTVSTPRTHGDSAPDVKPQQVLNSC
jgi:nucleotide-binding universal stress UspA family protein